jgi:PIN domain nuclease of toxin-antitoxin system
MKVSVLLDTSFLISLVDSSRTHHSIAALYYKYLLTNECSMYLSSIVAAEIAIKQPITDLPIKNFITIPFNIPHSIESGRIWNMLDGRDSGDNRSVVKDDMKIIAQALHEKIPFILTDDVKTFYKHCERLRASNNLNIKAVKLSDGFTPSTLRLDGQTQLDDFT